LIAKAYFSAGLFTLATEFNPGICSQFIISSNWQHWLSFVVVLGKFSKFILQVLKDKGCFDYIFLLDGKYQLFTYM
jgi:hypothetical protein